VLETYCAAELQCGSSRLRTKPTRRCVPPSAGESRWKRAAQIDTIIRTEAQRTFHRELGAASRHLTRRYCRNFADVALISSRASVEAIAQVDWGR